MAIATAKRIKLRNVRAKALSYRFFGMLGENYLGAKNLIQSAGSMAQL
jgi:hypothetical protein